MNTEQAVVFLHALGVKNTRIKENGWIVGSCPLAPWLHHHHTDNRPSFGFVAHPDSSSYFVCFACRSGSAEELVQMIELYAKSQDGSSAYDFALCHQLLAEEPEVLPLPEYQEIPCQGKVFQEWPHYWIESFSSVVWHTKAMAYLAQRNVSEQTIEHFDLRFDPKRDMLVCPYTDVYGRLAGARGRAIASNKLKHYDYTFQGSNNCRFVWYGESVLNEVGPVVVVEGQFDCWRTRQAFPKTLANLGAKPTWEKMQKLSGCPTLIQIPDNDMAGKESVYTYAKFCHRLGIDHQILWLDTLVKDPDECSVEYLRDRIHALL